MRKKPNFFNRWQLLVAMIVFLLFSAWMTSTVWATTMGDACDKGSGVALQGHNDLSMGDNYVYNNDNALQRGPSGVVQAIETPYIVNSKNTEINYYYLNPAIDLAGLTEENSLQANPSWVTQAMKSMNFADVNAKKTAGLYDVTVLVFGVNPATLSLAGVKNANTQGLTFSRTDDNAERGTIFGIFANNVYVITGQPFDESTAAVYCMDTCLSFIGESGVNPDFWLSVLKMPTLGVLNGSHFAAIS